ncbi:MAG: GGDEF domain-containing protein [bacterium]|nr:GGDEF domain-containing protein [bacterium]
MRSPILALLPAVGVLGALIVAGNSENLAPEGLLPHPAEMLVWCLAAALAALHRPLPGAALGGATLGLGTLMLPAALARFGAVPAALMAGLALLAADVGRGLAGRRNAAMRVWSSPWESLERATLVTGSVLAAGAAATRWLDPPAPFPPAPFIWRVLGPFAVYALGLALLTLSVAQLRRTAPGRTRRLRSAGADLLLLSLDAAGWTIGTLLLDAAQEVGWIRIGPLAAALALLAAEAARNAALRGAAALRAADLERMQHAHQRILGEISGMGGIAQQILIECTNVLPVQWFQFELPHPDGESRSWSAGPAGVLVEGEPQPPSRPEALPGVHRRVAWRVVEKPLKVEGETLAVVRLWCDPRRIEAGAEDLLSTLVPQMASSVHRAQLDREARLDPLTGVPVRRILESRLQAAYRECCEEGKPMAVIMCDIDFFKRINDSYGHAAGDAALVAFAQTLDAHRRDNDLCCRYGGEEFTLLLESTGGESALRLAERLRLAVEGLEFEFEGECIRLTFSSGVAAFPELHIKTASELLLLADEALYAAKEQGRNRCLLNLGKGAFRAPAGPTIRSREAPAAIEVPRIFG